MAPRKEETKTREIIYYEGRMINGSPWEKDRFNEKSTPSYKIEVAFPAGGPEDEKLWAALCSYAEGKWGPEGVADLENGAIANPLLDGDKLAQKRERKGKKGDAYRGMVVVRANTVFNHEGNDAPGGIAVFNEDAERIDFMDSAGKSSLYNGCMVRVAATIASYEGDDGDGLKFYLSAVQKIGEGERLVSMREYDAFKPTGRKSGGERRERARGEDADDAPRRRRPIGADDDEPVRRRR
jgi:hypothetical protein